MTVDLALAKMHLRILNNHEDALIERYVGQARDWIETFTSKRLVRGEVTQEHDSFPPCLPLFYGPNPEGISIAYTDRDGAAQTITEARLVSGRVFPASSWPSTAENTPITLTYTAGYETVPGRLVAAWLSLTAYFFEERGQGSVPENVESLCAPFRGVGF